MALWQAWANTLQQWQWMGMLLARLAVGVLFMLSGAGKLVSSARRQQMRQTLGAARIPEPTISAILVSLVECVFGALLIVGFLTPGLLPHADRCHAGSAIDHHRARNQGAIRS